MILFYSTLAHCAVPTRSNNKTHRLAFYISMLPRSLATPSELKRRKKALENLRTTSHWACISFKQNGEFPRTYGAEDSSVVLNYPLDKVKLPVLTDRMLELAGIEKRKDLDFIGLRSKPESKPKKRKVEDDTDSSSEDSDGKKEVKKVIKK